MGAAKDWLADIGRSAINNKKAKRAFTKGAKSVLREFAPHAGRRLQKGDGSIMRTYNIIRNALKKL